MEVLGKILAVIGIVVLIGVLMALPIMWLWNWLMPEIFGLITLNFWQALGISMLSSMLFKPTSNTNK